ncbi:imidazole glycerol phosphate synthase subunit HisH [Herbaspirillum sp. SJZ099]|uniref:imidazole glycerol phosphate synthase subunit HisH n=1 Tax=Herbaspirillum sp. SJZ099 TaxID=2572916 RepID=UPI0011A0799A|nr:imidazole glycerol phosphate synthase subunit HisH [Herbaspirillum sp. SJZ099]TWC68376.1 glutamine amidotransferase [Herbaspirillum sp. SJZ099]
MIAIVDYGMGNVRSLENAFAYFGHDVCITANENELAQAERIVLPGVGAFGDAMLAIRERNLDKILTHQAMVVRKPILGICLGMQLFAKRSGEHGEHEGLGWIDADIERLQVPRPLKVPHVGWNELHFSSDDWLFKGIRPAEGNFYFVHSFHMVCRNAANVIATTDYGGPVTAVVRSDNLVAAQFHPEKSQDNGLKMLENWVTWSPSC